MTYPLSEKLLGKPELIFGSRTSASDDVTEFYYARNLEKVLERAPLVMGDINRTELGTYVVQPFGMVMGANDRHSARLLLIEEIKPKEETADTILLQLLNTLQYGHPQMNVAGIIDKAREYLKSKEAK